MLILVFLLSILNIQKVLLKPTVANSEFSNAIEDDATRSKRQTAFFDLLNHAIEKYANCADLHLAPLKALANYKQYETVAYPDQLPQTLSAIAASMNLNQNNPKLKCTKVNLCSVENQHSHSSPGYNANAATSKKSPASSADVAKKDLIRHLYPNLSDNTDTSPYGLDESIFSRFLYAPRITNTKSVLKSDSQYIAGTEAIVGSGQVTQIKDCPCLEVVPAKQENNKELEEEKQSLQTFKINANNSLRSSKLDNAAAAEKLQSCPCLKATEQEITASNKTEEADSHDNKLFSGEATKWKQNFNLLFQQLDEMSHKVNNEDLKKMLEKLKTFKSAFKTYPGNKECTNSETTTGTETSAVSEETSGLRISQQTSLVEEKLPEIPSEGSMKNIFLELSKATNSRDHANLKVINSTRSSSSLKSTNSSIKPSETAMNTTTVVKTIGLLNNSNILQNLADIRRAHLGLNGGIIEDYIETVTTSSTALKANHTKNQDLLNISELFTLVSSKGDKSIQSSETNQAKIKEIETTLLSSNNNQTLTNSNSNKTTSHIDAELNDIKLLATNLNKSFDLITPIFSQNDSKITISITSNGNFKNIQVEQQLLNDKNLEINEKEKFNTATLNSKDRSMDMMGTGSRYVNILKQPQKKVPYAVPILSEMYSGTSRFRTKPPLTIYWHKIEETPLKLKRIPSEIWKKFGSVDIDDNESIGGNEENLLNMLRKGIDCEDIPYNEEFESYPVT